MNRFLSTCFAAASMVLAFILAAGPVQAQDAQTITFNEAIDIALSRNVSIHRSQNNLDLQSLRVNSERADFLPNLNISSGAGRSYGLSIDQVTNQRTNLTSDSWNVNANSSIPIFSGFQNIATLRGATATMESMEYGYERTRQDVVFNVIQNYLQVILNEETIGIQQENVDAQTRQLEQIQEFVNVGSRPVSDLYQQQAALAAAESALLTAQSNFELSVTRLIQVLQIDPLGDYRFVAPDMDELPMTFYEYDPETLLRGAFEKRADLRAQEANIDAARHGIRAAQSGYYPSLGFTSRISTRWSSNERQFVLDDAGNPIDDPNGDPILEPVSFADQIDANRSENIGLSLNIPLFNRLATRTNVESSQVQFRNAELDLENLQQTVAIEVRQAFLDYRTAVKRLDVTEKQVRAAQQALDVEEERYAVGASTLVELSQARASYVDAASQRAQAVFQFFFQQRLIDYYQGTLDPTQPLFE